MFRPEKFLAYLNLPYMGSSSIWFRTAVQRAIHHSYHNARAVVIFHTRKMSPCTKMNQNVLMLATSSVIYTLVCNFDNSYVGPPMHCTP